MNLPTRTAPSIIQNSPVLHYWEDKQCQPLVHPSDSTSLGNNTLVQINFWIILFYLLEVTPIFYQYSRDNKLFYF